MKTECCRKKDSSERALLFVKGELSDAADAEFKMHLTECDSCAAEVDAWRLLFERLEEDADRPCRDMTDDVMVALETRMDHSSGMFGGWRILSLAAMLLLALGLFPLFYTGDFLKRAGGDVSPVSSGEATQEDAINNALAWLAGEQDPDGSWSPSEWGGRDVYRIALTGISLMALQRRPELYRKERLAATDWLLGVQAEDGSFGAEGEPQMYNHGIATVALFGEYSADDDGGELASGLKRAVAFVRSRQNRSGGWGYQVRDNSANTPVTVWQIRALAHAERSGWGDSGGHLRRGLRWLSARGNEHGEFAYGTGSGPVNVSETLTAMSAYCLMTAGHTFGGIVPSKKQITDALSDAVAGLPGNADYYLLYFMAEAVTVSGIDSGNLLEQLRSNVASRRIAEGALKGTWEPDDAWGIIGGRLYTTAMAAMVLDIG